MLVHSYDPLLQGTLVKRYKRFFADIELENGEIITAHCPNTGPMTSVSTVGSLVAVSQSDNPKRKLAYTWEMILVEETWVGINTSLPNKVIGKMLEQRLIPELGEYDSFKPEVPYGIEKSRIDFVLSTPTKQTFLEIKNTTWIDPNIDSDKDNRTVLFPDTVTTRGQKHLRELIAIISDQKDSLTQAAILYFINRGDANTFLPGDRADPEYGRLLRAAVQAGVMVLPCRFQVTPQSIEYLGLASFSAKS